MACPGGDDTAPIEAGRELQVQHEHVLALTVHEVQHLAAVPVIDNDEV